MTTVEHGAVREIWLAKSSAPSTKYSFLIRDDAYSRQGAQFGRSLRLGDPITLGPNSTWHQSTWEGGGKQDIWKDAGMFASGDLCPSEPRGKLKLWPGLSVMFENPKRAVTRYILSAAPAGLGQAIALLVGENNDFGAIDPTSGTAVPPGGFIVAAYSPVTGITNALKSDFEAGIAFITRIADQGDARNSFLVGTRDGEFWVYDEVAAAWFKEADDANYPANANCAVVFGDAVYMGQGNLLAKRTWTTPGPAAYNGVKLLTNLVAITAMTVWNNQIWMTGAQAGGVTQVLVSDGVGVQPAFTFPDQFTCTDLISHYGSLYFAGFSGGALAGSGLRCQIWRYNGSSRTLLYESSPGPTNENHFPFRLVSHKQYLGWTRNGVASNDYKAGLMLYDAEVDAIIEGPHIDRDSTGATTEVHCNGAAVWADTWVLAFRDAHSYSGSVVNPGWCGYVKTDGSPSHTVGSLLGGVSFERQPTTRSDKVVSSVFDGGVAGESKVWLNARVVVKVPANSAVVIKAILDESGTEQTVTTISATADLGYRPVVFAISVAGAHLKSNKIQYVAYLQSTGASASPELDDLAFDYMVAPLRRRQWAWRVVCSDAQLRVDGSTPNGLATTQSQIDKLEELALGLANGSPEPLLMWDAQSSGGTPGGSADATVWVQSFQAQPFRLDSGAAAIAAEVALSVVELV